ncbi:uncharacterized protein LOC111634370 isoform X1 [Centruroides sculpturatus]|uniref:uncharacterized protein LOC111634370 isoform X1 n=1 Tax=Centruroides sculpturatus TaxID=218467 RepID=UPI000C6E967A|nr:uncharacterized protein LOC111634370 isoform X1 [Centruroides sculpturatus]XP_023234902.1 uncharacterized protein LOC111634370 isoform X1 [Centruroides sculpturatus]
MEKQNLYMFRPKIVSRQRHLKKGIGNLHFAPFLNASNKWMLERFIAEDIKDNEIQGLDKTLVISDMVNLIRMIQSTNPLHYQEEVMKYFQQFRVVDALKPEELEVQANLINGELKLAKPQNRAKNIKKKWQTYPKDQNSKPKNVINLRINELAKPLSRKTVSYKQKDLKVSTDQAVSSRVIELSKPQTRSFYRKDDSTLLSKKSKPKTKLETTKYSKIPKEINKSFNIIEKIKSAEKISSTKDIKSEAKLNTNKDSSFRNSKAAKDKKSKKKLTKYSNIKTTKKITGKNQFQKQQLEKREISISSNAKNISNKNFSERNNTGKKPKINKPVQVDSKDEKQEHLRYIFSSKLKTNKKI